MGALMRERVNVWLEKLAEKTPTPGGGSAAALAGAMSAALNVMVIRFTLKKASPARRAVLRVRLRRAEALQRRLSALVDLDARAYERMRAAYKAKRGVQPAVRRAALVPLETAVLSWESLALARDLMGLGNPYLYSDALGSATLAFGAVQAACGNVLINIPSLKSRLEARKLRERTKRLIDHSRATTIRLLHESRRKFAR